MVGQTPRLFKSGNTSPETYRQMWATLLTGKEWRGEFCNRKKNGELFWEFAVLSPLRNAAGAVTHFVGVKEDITQRKSAEHALHETSGFNQQIISGAQEGVVVYDRDLRYKVWNPYMEQLTGCSASEVIGRTPLEVFPFLGETGFPALCARALTGADTSTTEFEFAVPQTGRSGWCAHTQSALRNAGGEIIGIIAIVQDITNRKRAEAALRDSEERYRRLFELSPDAIFIQCQGKFHFLNPAAVKLFGASQPEQILGRPILEMIHPDFRRIVAQRIATLRDASQSVETIQQVYLRLDGTQVDVEVAAAPFAMNGTPAAVVIVRDITERKSLEKQLLRAQRVQSIGTLAAGIAHDLNNIFAPILLSAQFLQLDNTDQEEREILATIQTSAQRGADIVKQVLTFARGIEGQRLILQPKHLLKEIQKIIDGTFPKNILFLCNLPSDLRTVTGDATQLHQVLLNLCINARDAMPEGGTLVLEAENVSVTQGKPGLFADGKPGPHVVLRITDTGHGIPPALLEKIFDPFFTTKEQGRGTGLGLSTVLGIVRSHAGFVEVRSKPGRGTTFEVYLPSIPGSISLCVKQPPALLPRGAGECILVVDDEPNIRSVTERTLSQQGYHVILAANGKEALQVLARHSEEVKAVVTDIMMPVMDGMTLVSMLKQTHPHLPIVACTGWGQEGM
ncbi:MAG: PAS domain S-box protein, partial [Limisphaerales bacterium]